MSQVIAAPAGATLDSGPSSRILFDERVAYTALWSASFSKIVEEFLKKQDPSILNLRTPEASLAQASKETHEAIDRISNCRNEAHAEILGITENASKQDTLTAWRRLGCLVQPYMRDKIGGQAMIKLCNAAKGLGADWLEIEEVLFWDQKADLSQIDDDNENLEEVKVPEPPDRVKDIYNSLDTTRSLRQLALNPQGKEAMDKINGLNYDIIEGNKADGMRGSSMYQWAIKTSFFHPQYMTAQGNYDTIRNDPTNSSATNQIMTLRALIDEEIERQHYPQGWRIPTPRKYIEAKQVIENIMKCGPDDYNAILEISENATTEDAVRAWEVRGRLVHPDHAKQSVAEEAFQRLKKAAQGKGATEEEIDLVEGWDGEEDDDDEGNSRPAEDEVPMPPERVKGVYERATQHIESLKLDPDNTMADAALEQLNEEIKQGNRDEEVKEDSWNIPVSFFTEQYRFAIKYKSILDNDPARNDAARLLATLEKLIDMHIDRHHLPIEWAITERNQESKVVQAAPDTGATVKRGWEYPWATGLTSDNWTIVGVTPMGKKGANGKSRNHMVLLETMDGSKNGIPYQKYVSATDAGRSSVEQYINSSNYKNLYEAPGTWSRKNRQDFVKLLCVTDGRIKVHNSATRGKDVPTKCTVEFKEKGISVLSASDFYKVLGPRRGKAQVAAFCRENGFPAPWEREPMAVVNDQPKDAKTRAPEQRRIDHSTPTATKAAYAAVTTPRNGTTSHLPPPTQDQKIHEVETKMNEMEAKLTGMEAEMKKMVVELLALVKNKQE